MSLLSKILQTVSDWSTRQFLSKIIQNYSSRSMSSSKYKIIQSGSCRYHSCLEYYRMVEASLIWTKRERSSQIIKAIPIKKNTERRSRSRSLSYLKWGRMVLVDQRAHSYLKLYGLVYPKNTELFRQINMVIWQINEVLLI